MSTKLLLSACYGTNSFRRACTRCIFETPIFQDVEHCLTRVGGLEWRGCRSWRFWTLHFEKQWHDRNHRVDVSCLIFRLSLANIERYKTGVFGTVAEESTNSSYQIASRERVRSSSDTLDLQVLKWDCCVWLWHIVFRQDGGETPYATDFLSSCVPMDRFNLGSSRVLTKLWMAVSAA